MAKVEAYKIKSFEPFFEEMKGQLQSPKDALVLLMHHVAISKGIQCIGLGEDWPPDYRNIRSKTLPDNWNADQKLYKIMYADDKYRYLLTIQLRENKFIFVYWFNVQPEILSVTLIEISDYVKELTGNFETTFENLQVAATLFEDMIIGSKQPSKGTTPQPEASQPQAVAELQPEAQALQPEAKPGPSQPKEVTPRQKATAPRSKTTVPAPQAPQAQAQASASGVAPTQETGAVPKKILKRPPTKSKKVSH
ncbi:proteasome inhibitor PI31 subunit-like [Centruroides sculpturatus]|uniref:proteasome inhibitor PI31 subunit-like n=1 Tax=Centruroides sculpturatus TaxID=218467 RepID=UPI000C6CFAB4|nr:proteasome inhibitor PI31 subunit-like [Centruroides sculpturatus]